MSKILFVGLLQVVLAQNFPDARPYTRSNFNTGREVYYSNPDNRNLGIQRQDLRLRTDFSNSRLQGNLNQHELSNQQPLVSERTAANNEEYALSEGSESYNYDGRVDIGGVDNFGRTYHRVNQKKGQYKTNDHGNVDINSRFDTHDINTELVSTEYRTNDNSYQSSQNQVRTNENSSDVLRPTNEYYIELTTVPVVHLMSVTLKTNTNIRGRLDSETANDNIAERHNSDVLIFAEIDNRKPDPYDKTTTDNEVRFNKNGTDSVSEEDRWVWNGATDTTTTTSTEKVLTDGGLDDRTSLNGDGCPQGQAKVRGICTTTH